MISSCRPPPAQPLRAGGGLGNLATRTVAQDCGPFVIFSFLFLPTSPRGWSRYSGYTYCCGTGLWAFRGILFSHRADLDPSLRAGGDQRDLATHAVAQDCVNVCVVHFGVTFSPRPLVLGMWR